MSYITSLSSALFTHEKRRDLWRNGSAQFSVNPIQCEKSLTAEAVKASISFHSSGLRFPPHFLFCPLKKHIIAGNMRLLMHLTDN